VPEDLKVIMQGAIDDTTYYTRDMALQLNRAAQQNIQATSRIRVQELTGRQRTRWEEIAQEFYPRAYDRISKELIIKTLNQR
jgi:TRAP-type C4-dicarboxylate transport system substrate-binding protein